MHPLKYKAAVISKRDWTTFFIFILFLLNDFSKRQSIGLLFYL
jgi:hypothetical protein